MIGSNQIFSNDNTLYNIHDKQSQYELVGDQAIPTGVPTPVTYQLIGGNVDIILLNGTFTVQKSGLYFLSFDVLYVADLNDFTALEWLKIGTSDYRESLQASPRGVVPAGARARGGYITFLAHFLVGDTFQIITENNAAAGSPLILGIGPARCNGFIVQY